MKRTRNQIVQGLALAFAVFAVLVALADVNDLARTLRDFPPTVFGALVALKLVNWLFRYLQWHYLLGVVGVRVRAGQPSGPAPTPAQPATLNLYESVITFLVGFPMAVSPGKVGEVLKAAVVKQRTGIPIARTAPVVLTERIVDGLAVLIIIGLAGLSYPSAVFVEVEGLAATSVRGLILFTLVGMGAGLAVVQWRSLALQVLTLFKRVPVVRRLQPWLLTFYLSSYRMLKLRRLVPTVSFGLVAYGTDCLALYLMLTALDVPGGATLLAQASFILGFAVIAAALSAMPGGAGAREVSVSLLVSGIIGGEWERERMLS
ncbi:MAG: flippase-like domain-containing protein, partial [Anaerolineae bacterium]|nr:flippase-like domain-containing protein [Anaerolineae bacterium]